MNIDDAFYEEALPHYDSIKLAAYKKTNDESEAEDLTQQTFMRAIRYWESYENGTNCKAFLHSILNSVFINNKRKEGRYIPSSGSEGNNIDLQSVHSTHFSSGDKSAERKSRGEFSPELKKSLKELNKKWRAIVILRGLHNFKYEEIAYILDIPKGTVMSSLHRAREKLKEAIPEPDKTNIGRKGERYR